MMKRTKLFLSLFLFSFISFGQNLNSNTTGLFIYTPESPLNNKTIRVFYHIPNGDITKMPIVFSFHGANRNADDYRDYWISMANTNGFMVFAPEFSEVNFPSGDAYNLANIFDDGDNPSTATFNQKNEWTFSVIDPLFETIKTAVSGTQQKYNAWGHSAGSQFLQRFALYLPNSKLDIAVCSNAGWYTVPESKVNFPYGIKNGQLPNSDIVKAFSKKVFVHLGQNDTNPNASSLRRNTVVDNQQGIHRYERGQYFFNTSTTAAQNLNTPFNWEKIEVSNVGHNAQLMANDALQFILKSPLSNEEYLTPKPFKIYPNPTNSDYVNFSKNLNTPISVSVYNLLGEKTFKALIKDHILNISNLNSGVYLIKIESDTFSYTQKLVKK